MACSSSSNTHVKKYDVFLSFKATDTCDNFVSQLCAALRQKGIETFVGNELDRVEEVAVEVLETIERSKISVIIISESYASSPCCLDELTKILKYKKNHGQMVLPVFYGVDLAMIEEQNGSFGGAFVKHEEHFKDNTDKVQRWRATLTEAAKLSEWNSSVTWPESLLIEEIVRDIWKKLNYISWSEAEGLVGIESRVLEVEKLLHIGLVDVRIIGIWGMGGIGKTTLAAAIFNRFSYQFKSCCFLANVSEESEKHGINRVREELLSKLLEEGNLSIGNGYFGLTYIRKRLGRNKVLVVLDNVNNAQQLEFLTEVCRWFGPHSRIVVTSRDKHVLINGVDETYELKGLNHYEALKLFSIKAFKQNRPIEEYMELSNKVVSYAKGNPLALKVVGSSLLGKGKLEQESALDNLQRIPNITIQSVLRISFDGLDDEEQDIFLDIACFFKGEDRDHVTNILDGCGFSADIGISVLIEKSLITISQNKLGMHDLLQEMGWDIVHQKSTGEPGQCSRLWIPEEIYSVLTKNMGTEEVEGIFLDLSKIREMYLCSEAFARMYNLRLLKFYKPQFSIDYEDSSEDICKVHLPQGLESLSTKLRYLHWYGYPLKSLPSNFRPENLIELNLAYSNVQQLWNGVQHFVNLREIDLSHSKDLIGIPDLSEAKNLERMNFEGCTSLHEVPSSIEYLNKLEYLNLSNCSNLKNLPCSIHLRSYGTIYLSGCSNLTKIPDILGMVEVLHLSGTAIEELPSSIECLSDLVVINLEECTRLKNLQSNIYKLKSLEILRLSGCSNLIKFPDVPTSLDMLNIEEIYLSGTAIEELPSSIGHLTGLVKLDLENCARLESLPSSICKLKSLKKLNLSGCLKLESFPEIQEPMECLVELDLNGTSIKELTSSIEHLNALSKLTLKSCKNLTKLPENLGNLQSLSQKLDLNGCNLFKIPDSLGYLSSLKDLDLNGCNLFEIPSTLGFLSLLDCLNLSGNEFESIPASIKQLSRLQNLYLRNCKRLKWLPELPSRLECLDARDCNSMETVECLVVITEDWFRLRTSTSADNFIFCNCFNLDENARSSIMLAAQHRIQRMARASMQRSHREFFSTPVSFCLPGSEIPEWFGYQNVGSSLTVKLPQNLGDSKFLGFIFCVVASENYHDDSHLTGRCECHFKTIDGDSDDFNFPLKNGHGRKGKFRFVGSDHVLLWYSLAHRHLRPKKVEGYNLGDCLSKYSYTEASFEFYLSDKDKNPSHCCKVKKSGVCLLYSKHENNCNPTVIQSSSPYEKLGSTDRDLGEPMVEGIKSKRSRDDCSDNEAKANRSGRSDEEDDKPQSKIPKRQVT